MVPVHHPGVARHAEEGTAIADLALEWQNPSDETTGDLQVGPDGDLLTVAGYDETRQALTRLLLTNPRMPDPSKPGRFLPADDWANVSYGIGLRRYVGRALYNPVRQLIKRAILGGMKIIPGIAVSPPPDVQIRSVPGGGIISGSFTEAATGITRAIPDTQLTQ
jgi:hypothetical protein